MLHVDLWVAKRQVRLGQKFYKNTDLGLSKLGIGRMDVGLLEYRENGGRLWINNTWLPSNLIVARLMIPILIDIPRLHWDNVCEKAKDLSAMMVAHAQDFLKSTKYCFRSCLILILFITPKEKHESWALLAWVAQSQWFVIFENRTNKQGRRPKSEHQSEVNKLYWLRAARSH